MKASAPLMGYGWKPTVKSKLARLGKILDIVDKVTISGQAVRLTQKVSPVTH
jgi:hypothetical protein